jgi:hypothetical protein
LNQETPREWQEKWLLRHERSPRLSEAIVREKSPRATRTNELSFVRARR